MNRFSLTAQDLHTAFVLVGHDKKDGTGYADSRAIGAGVDMLVDMPGKPDDPSPRRSLIGVGRWPYRNCVIRLESGHMLVDSQAAPTKEFELYDFVCAHPGVSKAKLRSGFGGNKDAVEAAIRQLLDRNMIENRGTATWHRYHAMQRGADRGRGRGLTTNGTSAATFAGVGGSPAVLGGQGLTRAAATGVPNGAAPLGAAMATVGPISVTEPSDPLRRYPCPGGCGTLFSARLTNPCDACRQRTAAQEAD